MTNKLKLTEENVIGKARALGHIDSRYRGLKLRLKRDIIIPRGTIMEPDGCTNVKYFQPERDVQHIIGFGSNACGTLRIGTEVGDSEFDEWFQEIK
jgi:hypothetical protein